jgi:hypothetical protein
MELTNQNQDIELLENEMDIKHDKNSTSRLFFWLSFLGFFIFCWAGCYSLFQHKFKDNSDVKVPDNTLYNPKYK